MGFNFTGKKVLVTGAGRGIGKGLALALAEAGAVVYGLDKEQALLDTLMEVSPNVHPILADLADWNATRKAVENLEPLDGLVNNAGICLIGPSLTISKDILEQSFSVNTFGAINVTQVIGTKMVEAGNGGSIVNVSSMLGLKSLYGRMAYCMSKAALDMMTKQFALELGPHKIRVNSVNPNYIRTDMAARFLNDPVKAGKVRSYTPLGRFGEVPEVVEPIMYLLSDSSAMVTGTTNLIDGGLFSGIHV